MGPAHMTREEMREKLATELGFQIGLNVEADVRANQMTGEELLILADAAIALVRAETLEEAARVALEEYRKSSSGEEIAAAIRALKDA